MENVESLDLNSGTVSCNHDGDHDDVDDYHDDDHEDDHDEDDHEEHVDQSQQWNGQL